MDFFARLTRFFGTLKDVLEFSNLEGVPGGVPGVPGGVPGVFRVTSG
jgi:hypothetical protein